MQKSKGGLLAMAAMAFGIGPGMPIMPRGGVFEHPSLYPSAGRSRVRGRHAGKHNPAGTKLAKAVEKRRLGISTIR